MAKVKTLSPESSNAFAVSKVFFPLFKCLYVDPVQLRDKLARTMKKQVDLISPIPKKEKENKPQNQNKNNDEKKPQKEAPVTTAVSKVKLHCQGCIERIRKHASKTKGVLQVVIDKEKDIVTVKGTMDVKALVENLTGKLRRKVVVVPAKNEKKEKGKENENDGGGAGGEGKKNKQKGGESGGENQKGGEEGKWKGDQ